jgi:hypothetical protein
MQPRHFGSPQVLHILSVRSSAPQALQQVSGMNCSAQNDDFSLTYAQYIDLLSIHLRCRASLSSAFLPVIVPYGMYEATGNSNSRRKSMC